jgi:hypothetical protein
MISYSRRAAAFVQQLHARLSPDRRDTWVDWEDIPVTADWWQEICAAIEAADTFVFVITPDSLNSPVCHLEIDHPRLHNKRLLPIMRRDTDATGTPFAGR